MNHSPFCLQSESADSSPLQQLFAMNPITKDTDDRPLEDQECACALLSLKQNRSVTPEPEAVVALPLVQAPRKSSPIPILPHGYYEGMFDEEEERKETMKALLHPYSRKKRKNLDELPPKPLLKNHPEIEIESLMGDTKLVQLKDRFLVPDSLFVAMAQMKPARVTPSDRVGCYKSRPIGFVGMACRHCGGQPGFGTFFPETMRSLAQTTTSHTLLRHVTEKCPHIPSTIKNAVMELLDQEETSEARPRYGARKVFFERIWNRLHGPDAIPIEDDEPVEHGGAEESVEKQQQQQDESVAQGSIESDMVQKKKSSSPRRRQRQRFGALPTKKNTRPSKEKQLDAVATAVHGTTTMDDDNIPVATVVPRRQRFGALPTKKNLKRRMMEMEKPRSVHAVELDQNLCVSVSEKNVSTSSIC